MVQSANIYTYPYDLNPPVMRGTCALWRFGADWKNYNFQANIKSYDDDAIGIMFRYKDENNYYRFSWGGSHYQKIMLSKMVNNVYTILSQKSESGLYPHDWCTLWISAIGSDLKVYIGSTLQLSASDPCLDSGTIALYCWGDEGACFDDVIVSIAGSDTVDTYGGGMYNKNSSPTVTNCIFVNNQALERGGGMYDNNSSSLTVTNCIFRSNSVIYPRWLIGGGGMYNESSNPTVTNCIFNANTVPGGGAGGAAIGSYGDNTTVTNCVLWGNIGSTGPGTDEILLGGTGTITVRSSVVEGGTGQSWFGATYGNYDEDPLFVDANSGNLRLLPTSVCIDSGDNAAPGLPLTDIDGHQRIIDGDCSSYPQVDMGAYEFNYADKGDFNYNCRVDWGDFSLLAKSWLTQLGDSGWDRTRDISDPPDGVINLRDMAVIAENWLRWLPNP